MDWTGLHGVDSMLVGGMYVGCYAGVVVSTVVVRN